LKKLPVLKKLLFNHDFDFSTCVASNSHFFRALQPQLMHYFRLHSSLSSEKVENGTA